MESLADIFRVDATSAGSDLAGQEPATSKAKAIPSKPPRKIAQKAQVQDDFIMSTNNSSIVSKRSVEALYYPNEPAFFRFFVNKFKRRSPLINRGYHLRLKLIDVTLRDFLRAPSPAGVQRIVINLGAGSDVIPWQCLSRYRDDCHDIKFVDVDFPDLMSKKKRVILETPELLAPLTGVDASPSDEGPLMFVSDQYVQIGCDLRDLGRLQEVLALVWTGPCRLLFVAEVSITYMETQACDDLIAWANTLGPAQFCLLEQILPDGAEHPFAATRGSFLDQRLVKRLFHKLMESLGAVTLLVPDERRKLDEVEPFDEWEEFALFASHYCITLASNTHDLPQAVVEASIRDAPGESSEPLIMPLPIGGSLASTGSTTIPGRGIRRFGAALLLHDEIGHQYVANFLGTGTKDRLRSYDVYHHSAQALPPSLDIARTGPGIRNCHALADLGDAGFLLVGGRLSPSSPKNDAWILRKGEYEWRETHWLPAPLFRHSVVRLGASSLALLAGGRAGSTVSDRFLIFHPSRGWQSCRQSGDLQPRPTFGGLLTCDRADPEDACRFFGMLAGGIGVDGTVVDQVLRWEVDVSHIEVCDLDPDAARGAEPRTVLTCQEPIITFKPLTVTTGGCPSSEARRALLRFGSTALTVGHQTLVVGGVVGGDQLPQKHDILLCQVAGEMCEVAGYLKQEAQEEQTTPRPLLVGVSVTMTRDKIVVIMGGGATCFSMGTHWNQGPCSFTLPGEALTKQTKESPWTFWKTIESLDGASNQQSACHGTKGPAVKPIPRVQLTSREQFQRIVRDGQPAILSQIAIGKCVSTWTAAHLAEKVGEDREVVVHEAAVSAMDFTSKNFRYSNMTFRDFLSRVEAGQKLYLRALSASQPSGQPADLRSDFPCLGDEFALPPELALVLDNQFSSVLRVSGPVNMWLHYDVMANVYCQITGSKRLILFPPSDVDQLSFAPGASSSGIDVFASLDSPSLSRTHPHEAILEPGDVLFLPPVWPHTASPVSNTSIAVNVFFRDPDQIYAPGRDVYGNRDLLPYLKGRQDLGRMAASFEKVTGSAKSFYMARLAQELLDLSRA